MDRLRSADSIPGYRIERLVHRGGQGVVYRAIRLSSDRIVALKVMRDRPLRSRTDRVRFEREVEILTELDHPNIVRILDSGEVDGLEYLAMDFVDGVALDRVAPATQEEILRLFADVCDAVHAAHLRGVIHRDLKPGNIIVDAERRPRVLDFGLAKRIALEEERPSSETTMTETGQFLGSLPWASPEQVSGAVGTIDLRSDVYSLGVILYQLLTGVFPYQVSGPVRDVTESILTAVPTPPRSISRAIDGELETIVLTALAKEPPRRYQSAGELARDIRHYLAGELIEAKRDSLPYVIRKQLRRHWIPATVAAGFLAVILAGGVTSTWLWRTAVAERDLKERQRSRAESISAVLHDILASADTERAAGEEITVASVLEGTARELEAGSLESIPDVEASVRRTLGEAYLAIGRLDAAGEQLRAARALDERVHGARHVETGRTIAALGRLALARGESAGAVALLREAVAILDGDPDAPHEETPATLLALATALSRVEDERDVPALHERALEIAKALHGPDHAETARVELAIETFRHGGARTLELLDERLRLLRRAYGPRHPEIVRTLTRRASELHVKGRLAESEQGYLDAIALGRELHGDDHPDVLRSVTNLVWLHEQSNDDAKALELLRAWEGAARATFGAATVRFAEFLMIRGRVALTCGERAGGRADLARALAILADAGEDRSWQGAECRIQLARAELAEGRVNEAERLAQEILAIRSGVPERMSFRTAQAEALLGEILVSRGAHAEAEALLLHAYEVLEARTSMPALREHAVRQLVRLYESWDAAEPGRGFGAKAQEWLAQVARAAP